MALLFTVVCGHLCCVTNTSVITKNEYGLQVISKANIYKQTVKANKNKRMVALSSYLIPLKIDWPYASPNNFAHQVLYTNPVAYMRIEAALALQKISDELKSKGLGLKIFDAYRPYSVTKKMWSIVPDERYAANPAKGSGHNRGAAVDLTLYNLSTGAEIPMPTAFDDFTEKAHHNFMQLDTAILQNRKMLKGTMERYGFVALDTEWWHYYLPNAAQRFELLDLSFEQLKNEIDQ